jgi:uncharacterized protein (TIGR03083 family)
MSRVSGVRPREHIDAAERQLDGLCAAVGAGSTAVPVPTCPDWTVADLATHVAQFCGFWAHVLCEGSGRPKPSFPDPPVGEAIAGWLAEVGPMLVAELRATPAETPVWTWYQPDQTAGFVARRAAHELTIHRYDAQSARGRCDPIDAVVAADGIDELVGTLVVARDRSGAASGQTLHVHGTDDGVAAEWLVVLGADTIEVRRQHGKGDLALRGAASDLELLLYGRPTLGAVERFGDASVLDAWYREFTF